MKKDARVYAEIPWQLMDGFRDVLMHACEGVDLRRVWTIASRDLPVVRVALERTLPPLPELERELAGEDPTKSIGDGG